MAYSNCKGRALVTLAAVAIAAPQRAFAAVWQPSAVLGEPVKVHRGTATLLSCKELCVENAACRGIEYHTSLCTLLGEPDSGRECKTGFQCLSLVRDATEVFVMLPLDTVTLDGELADPVGLKRMLDEMASVGVDGFMVDVWWGITEPRPQQYRFDAYKQLLELAKERNLAVQCVASFHRCGGNHGDDCNIPLPAFTLDTEGVWYRDAAGRDDREYISLFADDVAIAGRTPLQMYGDWLEAFAREFAADLGGALVEVMVGMGPSGELRYPSYRLGQWRYCGIGEFQAYDPYALASLATAAGKRKEWAQPPKAGDYNSYPEDTDFFTDGFKSERGQFFLDWYSSALKAHGMKLLSRAQKVFDGRVRIAGKVAGIHWWYGAPSHAAELTAGYYNTNGHNAYAEIADVFKAAGATFDFTCMEMRNKNSRCNSKPEDLVHQVLLAGKEKAVPISGENALQRYDDDSYSKMLEYKGRIAALTYLRLTPTLLEPSNLSKFRRFVARMRSAGPRRRLLGSVEESVLV